MGVVTYAVLLERMNLNYSALKRPTTSDDMAAYNAAIGSDDRMVWRAALFVGIILLASMLLIVGLSARSGGDFVSTMFLAVAISFGIGFIGILIFVDSYLSKKKRAQLYAFARDNNLAFLIDEHDPSYAGLIFGMGRHRSIQEAFVFPDGTEIGNYTYTTGYGRSTEMHCWGYARVKISRHLPNMLLDAKSNNGLLQKWSDLSDAIKGGQVLALEGNFSKYFTLHVPEGYESDALYLFTPDVMSVLISTGAVYDIEIIDDNLIFYQDTPFNLHSVDQFEVLFRVIDTIKGELSHQSANYRDDRGVTAYESSSIGPGRRLEKSFQVNISLVLGIITIAAITIFLLVSRLTMPR